MRHRAATQCTQVGRGVRRPAVMRAVCWSVAACAVVLGACGGDGGERGDDGGATTTTAAAVDAEQWTRTVDDGCVELNERYADLADASPADREAAVAYAERVEDFSGELVELIDEAGSPEGLGADAELFLDTVRELDDAAAALADAAEQGDAEAASDAAGRLDELGARLNPLADELGITACGGF